MSRTWDDGGGKWGWHQGRDLEAQKKPWGVLRGPLGPRWEGLRQDESRWFSELQAPSSPLPCAHLPRQPLLLYVKQLEWHCAVLGTSAHCLPSLPLSSALSTHPPSCPQEGGRPLTPGFLFADVSRLELLPELPDAQERERCHLEAVSPRHLFQTIASTSIVRQT